MTDQPSLDPTPDTQAKPAPTAPPENAPEAAKAPAAPPAAPAAESAKAPAKPGAEAKPPAPAPKANPAPKPDPDPKPEPVGITARDWVIGDGAKQIPVAGMLIAEPELAERKLSSEEWEQHLQDYLTSPRP